MPRGAPAPKGASSGRGAAPYTAAPRPIRTAPPSPQSQTPVGETCEVLDTCDRGRRRGRHPRRDDRRVQFQQNQHQRRRDGEARMQRNELMQRQGRMQRPPRMSAPARMVARARADAPRSRSTTAPPRMPAPARADCKSASHECAGKNTCKSQGAAPSRSARSKNANYPAVARYPNLGFGLGLRSVHFGHVLERRPKLDFFEAVSENFLDTEGRPSRSCSASRSEPQSSSTGSRCRSGRPTRCGSISYAS